MKSIAFSVAFLVVWIVVSHFFPIVNLAFAFLVYPSLFILGSYFFRNSISSYAQIPFYFSIILGNDFLFRLYGGGIHDDAGRGWCELVFYMTLATSTLALIVVKVSDSKSKIKVGDKLRMGQIVMDVSFVFAISIIVFFFYKRFNTFV